MSEEEASNAHFVLVPLMAPGHMIPMVDLAKLLAGRGATVTVVATPSNASRFRAPLAGDPRVTVVPIPFPAADFGLPEKSESFDSILPHQFAQAFRAARMMRAPVEAHLRRCPHPPTCIVSDSCQPWTRALATAIGVPRVSFWCVPAFALLAWHNIFQARDTIYGGGAELFAIPGISPEILVTTAQVPPPFPGDEWEEFREEYIQAEAAVDGVIVNTFHALEPLYLKQYKNTAAAAGEKRVWAAGPFLASHSPENISQRGSTASADDVACCLSWLDSKPAASVVYVSFGSVTFLTTAQLVEIGAGLESSGLNFLWVVKQRERSPELDGYLAGDGGFEERVAGRGMVVFGWAPQRVVLSHAAVGGFLTHCGWNSTLESITAGVPMAVYPIFGDQFLNARLLVDVLRVAVDVVVSGPSVIGVVECLVGREAVRAAVVALMDHEGEEGSGRRERVMALKEEARKAMESGGSSHQDLGRMIHWLVTGNEADEEYSGEPAI